jgi:cytochrome bd-type quinol oxidase subunit 1
MRTADGVSPIVSGTDVLVSLLGFGVVYLLLAALWLWLLRRVFMAGPDRVGSPLVTDLVETSSTDRTMEVPA